MFIPNFFNEPSSASIETSILGRSCFSMTASLFGLDCNPAHLANQEKHLMRFNLNLDSDAKHVVDYSQDLKTDDAAAISKRASNQFDPLVSRASTNFWYQHEWWSIKWTPARASAAIYTRNKSVPEISAHLLKESELMAQAGFFVADNQNIQVGFQARYLDRDYLRDQFTILQIAMPNEIRVEHNRAVYLEPGIVFSFENDWNPRLSAMLSNIEVYRNGDRPDVSKIVDVGISTNPDFWSKKITSAIHYTSRPDIEQVADRFTLATGLMLSKKVAFHMAVSTLSQGLALSGRVDSLLVALGFKNEDIAPESWKENKLQQFLFELGLAF